MCIQQKQMTNQARQCRTFFSSSYGNSEPLLFHSFNEIY
jgi:hypothetical protein